MCYLYNVFACVSVIMALTIVLHVYIKSSNRPAFPQNLEPMTSTTCLPNTPFSLLDETDASVLSAKVPLTLLRPSPEFEERRDRIYVEGLRALASMTSYKWDQCALLVSTFSKRLSAV